MHQNELFRMNKWQINGIFKDLAVIVEAISKIRLFALSVSSFNAEIIHATNGYYHRGGEYSCIYISGYLYRKMCRFAGKAILMPIINCIHFCPRSNI